MKAAWIYTVRDSTTAGDSPFCASPVTKEDQVLVSNDGRIKTFEL